MDSELSWGRGNKFPTRGSNTMLVVNLLLILLLGSKKLRTNVLELHFVILANHDQNVLVLLRLAQSVFICKVGIECSVGFTVQICLARLIKI